MNIMKLNAAMIAARLFIKRGEAVRARGLEEGQSWIYVFCGCAETGACKRSSMELTRALAELRKA